MLRFATHWKVNTTPESDLTIDCNYASYIDFYLATVIISTEMISISSFFIYNIYTNRIHQHLFSLHDVANIQSSSFHTFFIYVAMDRNQSG